MISKRRVTVMIRIDSYDENNDWSSKVNNTLEIEITHNVGVDVTDAIVNGVRTTYLYTAMTTAKAEEQYNIDKEAERHGMD